jgi:hypothetical protein
LALMRNRGLRARCWAVTVVLCAGLVGAAGATASAGPVATKSGAIVNFTTTGKLKVAKRIQPLAVCSVNCDVTGTGVLRGMGGKASFSDSRSFPAGRQFGLYVTVKGALLKLMKANPGKFRLTETLTATDPTTGAIDTVSRTFRFKGTKQGGGGVYSRSSGGLEGDGWPMEVSMDRPLASL